MQTDLTNPYRPGSQRILGISLLILWAAVLVGVLQVHKMSGSLPLGLSDHSICGPWGCGPPMEALVSYHGFWLVLLLPIGWWIGKASSVGGSGQAARRLRQAGFALMGLCFLTWIVIVAVDAFRWQATSHTSSYLCQRMAFRVITLVDVPLLPLTCVGWIWIRQGARGLIEKVEGPRKRIGASTTVLGAEDRSHG